MVAHLRLYAAVARLGFRRYSTYLGATIGGLFTNVFFGFFRAYTFVALFAAAGGAFIGGYDLADTLTYAFLTQSVIAVIAVWGWWDISRSIRTGDIVTDLMRPYDYQAWWLAQDAGRAAFQVLGRGIVPIVAGSLVFGLRLPQRPQTWGLVAASVALAVLVSFGIRFLANLATFWTLDHRGSAMILMLVWTGLGGMIVPVNFFPEPLRSIAGALPFAATIQAPIDVFLEQSTGTSLAGALAVQALWAAVLIAAGRVVLAVARRRVVTQGG